MRLLCRYAGGLACLVTALALVACGGGPGSQPEPKPIENIAFSQGEKARTISLSDKFNGSDLTYSATTSNVRVATVTVDNDADTLTVTAVAAGTATITVTAKNSRGEAKQTFTVTVPKPPPAPVEFTDIPSLDKDASETIPLGNKFSGDNLTYSASSSHDHVIRVTVDTANTLTLTAVGPGQAIITVTATATTQGSTPQTKTFTVTVPQPASEATAPTVKTGVTSTVSVAVGAASTVALSTVFDGATSYTATSSASTIVTASESGGILTITGVSSGPATITIVATNTAGSSPAHAIAVTVTAPATTPPETPTTSSGTLTIKRGESAKRTLPAGQTLEAIGDGVKAERSHDGEPGNVWIIIAKKKGIHKVTVLSAGKAVGTITVEVPNSRPVRQDQTGDPVVSLTNPTITLSVAKPDAPISLTGSTSGTTINDYFTDADQDDIRYRIEDQPPWLLINTEDGFVEGAVNYGDDSPADVAQLTYEILQKVVPRNERDYEFTVSLYASDGEEESTRPVVIEFNVGTSALTIGPETYDVDQNASGNFRDRNKDGAYNNKLEVGPRREVTHTAEFSNPTAGSLSGSGFRFVENAHEDIPAGDRPSGLDLLADATTILYRDERNSVKQASDGMAGTIPTSYETPGTRYFLVRSSGAVVIARDTNPITVAADPSIPFSLKSSGSSGAIIIDYKVWLDKNKVERDHDDDPATPDIEMTTATKTATKTLQVGVLVCSSPPNPISDCK